MYFIELLDYNFNGHQSINIPKVYLKNYINP